MKTKLAIFDIDGTLFDGNLGVEFIKVLVHKGLFTKEIGETIFDWYGKYKSGEVEKAVAVDECYKLYAIGMKGMDKQKANEVAQETWQGVIGKMYRFTSEIINTLRNEGYIVLLLSGSPMEMVKKLGNLLQINEENVIAGEIEIIDNIYTGNIVSYPGSAKQKVEALTKLINERNLEIDWQSSIGVGDDERDSGILGKVGHSIMFNPDKELANEGKKNGWILTDEETISAIIKENVKS